MTYFAVLGKTPELSLAELQLVQPTDIQTEWSLVFFQTQHPERIWQLWGIIKRGEVVDEPQLKTSLQAKKLPIVWVDSNELGLMIKRNYGIRRYKVLDWGKTDLEIKRKWAEVFALWDGRYGLVTGWQDVDMYSAIDFDKPAAGMQIGMMPAKLTHILVNIWVSQTTADIPTIWDPFCGFGTTNFVANHLGHHTIWSDINITPTKQNLKRWKTHELHQEEGLITLFKHDVNDEFSKPFLDKVDMIVTEWRLGPVVKQEMLKHKNQTHTILKDNLWSIVELYSAFLTNTKKAVPHVPIVMTVPEYLRLDHPIISDRITEAATELGYAVTPTWEVYQRKWQQVGRRVLVLR